MDVPGGAVVKNPSASAGDAQGGARSLGGEDPLEGEMAAHPSILAWRIPSTWEPGGLRSVGPQRVRHDLATEHEKQQAFEMDFFHSAQLFYFSIHLEIST